MIGLSCSITAAEAERHRGREGERGRGNEGGTRRLDRSLHQHGCSETQRMSSDSDSSFLFFLLSSPAPPPPALCLISQIWSHVTIRHLYNRGHPLLDYTLYPQQWIIYGSMAASAKSIIDECIIDCRKYIQF